jgi:hypothetical protein
VVVIAGAVGLGAGQGIVAAPNCCRWDVCCLAVLGDRHNQQAHGASVWLCDGDGDGRHTMGMAVMHLCTSRMDG